MDIFDRYVKRLIKASDSAVYKEKQAILRAYSPELVNTLKRVSEIKNLLYRNKPAKIADIFVEPVIRHNDDEFTATQIFDLFSDNQRIILRGSAGLGKSVLMKQFCLRHVDNQIAFAPLFLELRKVSESTSKDIAAALFETYNGRNYPLGFEEFQKALESRTFSVLLDGFDEVQPSLRDGVEGAILRFANQFPACPLIVSGRSERSFLSWEQFVVYDLAPMDEKSTVELISKLDVELGLKERFISEAIPRLFQENDKSFIQTPLLAILMLLTYSTFVDVPKQMHIFYANAFETLLRDHDVTKSQFRRPLVSGIAEEDFKRIFSAFCALTYFQKKFEFSFDEIERAIDQSLKATQVTAKIRNVIDDLTLSICVMQYENLEYSFVHRSFQEYFSAVYLRDSPMSVVSAFLDSESSRRENVIPMLMGMDRDRIEKEWVIGKLNLLRLKFAGNTQEERIEKVFKNYWGGIKLMYGDDHIGGMHPPEIDYFANYGALEAMYQGPWGYSWWIDDYEKRSERLLRALKAPEAIPYLKEISDEGRPSSIEDIRIDVASMPIEVAITLGLDHDAIVFLHALDTVYAEVNKRVTSRDHFAASLFKTD